LPAQPAAPASGIVLGPLSSAAAAGDQLTALLAERGLGPAHCELAVHRCRGRRVALSIRLSADALESWRPGHDTLDLSLRLKRDFARTGGAPGPFDEQLALEREILVALLGSPVPVNFPSFDELTSALRMRVNLCRAASRTAMDFHTAKVDRPASEWHYDEDRGFTLREARDLIGALRLTTQPDISGRVYAFSCYRATEYIVLLGMAEEMRRCHPALLAALEAEWRRQAIASGRFHDTFLHELGSNEAPLPMGYYVPGDRVWFRNPDEASADASGYEGSWTMYMGQGLFANMWKRDEPFTILTKCVEIYHWRDAVYRDAEGDARVDESVVRRHVEDTLADEGRSAAVFERMHRLRDLKGVYAGGGCIDRTREGPRWIRPGTTDIPIPPLQGRWAPESFAGDTADGPLEPSRSGQWQGAAGR
jgi:hypothetical protein